jgi:hypothetical protein
MESLLLGSIQLASVREIARWFGAVQAQDLASAEWSFGLRLKDSSVQDIDAAIERREVLRTWPMRGTLHFVPTEDAAWMLELTGKKALAGAATRRAYLGLSEKTVHLAADILARELEGGKRLLRSQAIECLLAEGIDAGGQNAHHLLWYASQIGVTCIGPNEGKEQTLVLLSEWAPHSCTPETDEALGILARRYFQSHGPVSKQDFMGWTGLSAAEAARGIAVAEPHLASCTVEGKAMWMDNSLFDRASSLSKSKTSTVHVLPGFDEYLLGIKDRSLFVLKEHMNKIIPGNNGMFMPTMVANGMVVGTWKRTIKKAKVEVVPSSFSPLSRTMQSAFEKAFAAYAKYLDLEPKIGG